MTRRIAAIVALLFAFAVVTACAEPMRSALTWRLRKAERDIVAKLDARDRFTDYSTLIRVVRQDEAKGRVLLPGKPKLVVLDEVARGGVWDAVERRFIGWGKPGYWYTDELSIGLLLHGDEVADNILLEGAMGTGKSTFLAQWISLRAFENAGTGGEIGVTAATNERMGPVLKAFHELSAGRNWYRWRTAEKTATYHLDVTARFLGTHRSSEAEGSRIQAYNWVASANDELKDYIREDGDIEARGRDAANYSRYKRIATTTLKDAPEYRDWKDRVLKAENGKTKRKIWIHVQKHTHNNPFLSEEWWERLRGSMTPNEYSRKVLLQDVPSEDRVYNTFARKENIQPCPRIGTKDVTATELGRLGFPSCHILAGHDPGRIKDVTVFLKAYQTPERIRAGLADPLWWVVGEVITERSTTETHGLAVLDYARKRWGHVPFLMHIDPHTKNGHDEEQPDYTVVATLENLGLNVRAAAYKLGTTGTTIVPRNARIDMVNTLFCSAKQERRLFIDCTDAGVVAAPKLVEALEKLERDEAGRAERERKGKQDKTHLPAALGYALWKIEKPRLDNMRRAG